MGMHRRDLLSRPLECTVGAVRSEERFTPVDGYGLDASWEKFIVMKNFEFIRGKPMLTRQALGNGVGGDWKVLSPHLTCC